MTTSVRNESQSEIAILYRQRRTQPVISSVYCKRNDHIECSDCMCNCHIPGTMENLAKKIAQLDRKTPGIGETI